MRLFDDFQRTDSRPIQLTESSFDWLNRSSKEGCDVARARLQLLFDRYPAAGQKSWLHRFKSSGTDHHSAIAELYIHELLRASGYTVHVENAADGGSRPDFEIETADYRAYVEVALIGGHDRSDIGDARLRTLVAETTQRVRSTGFGINLTDVRIGNTNPAPRAFAAQLDDWFGSFDHSQMRSALERGEAMPEGTFTSTDGTWRIRFRLWPLETADQKNNSIVGISGFRAGWSTAKQTLRSVIDLKKRQHRTTQLPLTIATVWNDFANEPDQEDIVDVLLGQGSYVVDLETTEPPRFQRASNGLWHPNSPLKSARPVGLLLVRRVFPWTINDAIPELWDNPLASPRDHLPLWEFSRCFWDVKGKGELVEATGTMRTLHL